MMTRQNYMRLVVAMVVLMAATTLWASPITVGQAQRIASRLMAGKTLRHVPLHDSRHVPRQGTCHVFNAWHGQGYVIIAGDDRLPTILGYSDTGTLDVASVPPALRELLDYYAQCATSEPGQPSKLTERTAVAPLTRSIWGQSAPFNTLIQLADTTAQGDTLMWHATVGSAATAMAQLMYYHKWPVSSVTSIPEYTTPTLGYVMPQLPDTTLAWSLMRDAYNATDSTDAAAAVALLNLYCAQALQTDLLKTGSNASALTIPGMMAQYFDYAPTARFVKRETYSSQEWEDMAYNELQSARPIIYRADNGTGEHTFIVDGCDDAGLFHINWGWNGQCNGYYVLSDLNPAAQGMDGAQGQCGYIYKQGMVIGTKPNDGSLEQHNVRFHSMTVHSMSDTPIDSIGNYKVNVTGVFHNNSNTSSAFDYGWGIFLGDDMLSTLATKSRTTPLPPGYQVTSTFDLEFGVELSDSTYLLRPIWSELNEENWKVCEGGLINYIEVTIVGDSCTYQLHGNAGTPEYMANDLTFAGTLHAGKQVTATASLTNLGNTMGDIIYILDNGAKANVAMVSLDKDNTGDVKFYFTPDTAGIHTITLSLQENGSDTLIVRELEITEMPAATLSFEQQLLNVTDTIARVITSHTYSLEATITNLDTVAYNEDIVLRLWRVCTDSLGIIVQDVAMPLQLAPGETRVVQLDCDNVTSGEQYYAWLYYYSAGERILCGETPTHTLVFPDEPCPLTGDINGDGKVDISDVNIVINIMLGKALASDYPGNANVDGQGLVDISDVNAVINIMLGK